MRTPYKFDIFHPNGKGMGSALTLELYKASEANVGKVILSITPQKPAVSETGKPLFPTFNWESRTAIRLEVAEVELMLEVFAGETESIADGKGLRDIASGVSTTFRLRHIIDPVPGYVMEIAKRDGDETIKRAITLTMTEGRMLYHGLTASMGALMFGE